jgi:hypothetical protein
MTVAWRRQQQYDTVTTDCSRSTTDPFANRKSDAPSVKHKNKNEKYVNSVMMSACEQQSQMDLVYSVYSVCLSFELVEFELV